MVDLELKSDLKNLIDRVNDPAILSAVKAILSQQVEEPDFWDELPESVQQSVQRGIAQAARGETKAHEEVISFWDNRQNPGKLKK